MFQAARNVMAAMACVGALALAPAAWAADAGPIAGGDTATMLREAAAGSWRTPANAERDRYRHPVETLEFFGIRPDMTVVEISPGGGWYTDILAPFLYAHGHLVEATAPKDSKSPFMAKMATAFQARLDSNPAVFGHVGPLIPFAPPAQVKLGPAGSADMVLTFRNTHDWLNHDPDTLAKVFKAAFDVLKPGGVFGVTEHRARASANAQDSSKKLHRLPEDYLIELGLKTGFRLAAVSQINANPNDPGDINIHRLPPSLAGPEAEHAKMQAIGESDRMTLKFVKP